MGRSTHIGPLLNWLQVARLAFVLSLTMGLGTGFNFEADSGFGFGSADAFVSGSVSGSGFGFGSAAAFASGSVSGSGVNFESDSDTDSDTGSTVQPLMPRIDQQVLRTGDTFTYRIAWLPDRPYDELVPADSAQFAPDFVIRSMQATSSADTLIITYTLQLFGIDIEQLPALSIGLRAGRDTTFIPVASVPVRYEARVQDTEEELRPLKPIFPFLRNWWPLVLASLLVLLGLLAALWWWIRRRQAAALMPAPAPPGEPAPYMCPLETLRSEFERIRAGIPHPERAANLWYTALSEAVRQYLDQVHLAGSMESTTTQTLRNLADTVYDQSVLDELGSVLRQADLVKFARHKPVRQECDAFFDACQALANTFALADAQLLASRRMAYEADNAAQNDAALHEAAIDAGAQSEGAMNEGAMNEGAMNETEQNEAAQSEGELKPHPPESPPNRPE